jgi:hypothetical protein
LPNGRLLRLRAAQPGKVKLAPERLRPSLSVPAKRRKLRLPSLHIRAQDFLRPLEHLALRFLAGARSACLRIGGILCGFGAHKAV